MLDGPVVWTAVIVWNTVVRSYVPAVFPQFEHDCRRKKERNVLHLLTCSSYKILKVLINSVTQISEYSPIVWTFCFKFFLYFKSALSVPRTVHKTPNYYTILLSLSFVDNVYIHTHRGIIYIHRGTALSHRRWMTEWWIMTIHYMKNNLQNKIISAEMWEICFTLHTLNLPIFIWERMFKYLVVIGIEIWIFSCLYNQIQGINRKFSSLDAKNIHKITKHWEKLRLLTVQNFFVNRTDFGYFAD